MAFPLPVVAATPIKGELVQTVRGRDVHAFLGVAKDYSTWIKVQIERARLKPGRDFIVEEPGGLSPQKGENPPVQFCAVSDQGLSPRIGRPRTEYHLTLDAAKHVGMLSGTERGHDLREYFLECERRARAAVSGPALPQTLPEALRLAADLAEENARQSAAIATLTPRSEALAVIADSAGSFCIRDAAKMLQTPETRLRSYLAAHGWIYRRERGGPWVAHSDRLAQRWLTTKVVDVATGDGRVMKRPQARITCAGLVILAQRLGRPVPPEAMQPLPLIEAARPHGGL